MELCPENLPLLTIDGVRVATKGYSDGLQANGFAPLGELVQQLVTLHQPSFAKSR